MQSKKPYTPPRLTTYGDVEKLTFGASKKFLKPNKEFPECGKSRKGPRS